MDNKRTESGRMDVNFTELLRMLVRRLPLILLAAVVGALALYAAGKINSSDDYTSTGSLYIMAKETSGNDALNPYWNGYTENDLDAGNLLTVDTVEIVQSASVLEEVIANLGLEETFTTSKLAGMITVTRVSDARIVKISLTAGSGELAQNLTEEILEVSAKRLESLMTYANVTILDTASAPVASANFNGKKQAVLGGGIGAALVILILLIRFLSDDTLHGKRDPERYLGIPCVGALPLQKEKSAEADAEMKRAVRNLRAGVHMAENRERVFAVVSSGRGEGKTTTAALLAAALAESGKRTLYLDTDSIPHPAPELLGVLGEEEGLFDVLAGKAEPEQAIRHTNTENLYVITAGAHANPDLLESDAYGQLIAFAREHYDYVLTDTTAISVSMEGVVAAAACDSAILVAESGVVSAGDVDTAVQKLKRAGCPVFGIVLNKMEKDRN